MNGETIFMIIFSAIAVGWAIKVLENLFRWAITTMKKVGSFVVAILPASIAAFASTLFMDATQAQVMTQMVTTDLVAGAIGLAIFGDQS